MLGVGKKAKLFNKIMNKTMSMIDKTASANNWKSTEGL